ncbi:ATP cone domain-containing protein [Archaeoglobus sp.]
MLRVRKRDGRLEEFSKAKIIRTCLRAGASKRVAERVADEVERRIYDGISTDEVLELVIELLLKHEYPKAERYDLKRSLLRLGPSGFGFEKFVARLLEEYGFKTETNVIIQGKCVEQEIDVVAEKGREKYMIECKFHNQPIYTGLKEAMYTYARFLDVEGYGFTKPWIFTNTKFSEEAKRYASCMGIRLTGWNYPVNEGIEVLLESRGLYPVTILRIEKEVLDTVVNAGLVFCRDIVKACEPKLRALGLSKDEARRLVEEAKKVIS